MRVTEFTRDVLRHRREVRRLERLGYRKAAEPFWELNRGVLCDHRITEVAIGPDGKSLWCKIEPDRTARPSFSPGFISSGAGVPTDDEGRTPPCTSISPISRRKS